MRCINKRRVIGGFIPVMTAVALLFTGCSSKKLPMEYNNENNLFGLSSQSGRLPAFASDLCVSERDVPISGLTLQGGEAAGLFDINNRQVVYGKNIHERLYPASTTKILTAYLVMKYGGPDDIVTVSAHAVDLPSDAQVCGFKEGDKIKLSVLLRALLVYSGNDAAIALAEHVSGSEKEFVELMNKEARAMGATQSHFTNPDGLHDEEHYTTAYDLYLMFQKAMEYDEFREIINLSTYTGEYIRADGGAGKLSWETTNFYLTGGAKKPSKAVIVGGKTGTTKEAGACLVILSQDDKKNDYISVVLKEPDKIKLYTDMTNIIDKIPN